MTIVANQHEGVVLTAEFARSSTTLTQEVDEFTQRLAALQQELGFSDFLCVQAEDDKVYTIHVIPASSASATAAEQVAGQTGGTVVAGDAMESPDRTRDFLARGPRLQTTPVEVEARPELQTGVLALRSKPKK